MLTRYVSKAEPVSALLRMENVGGPKAKVDVMISYAVKAIDGAIITESTDTIAVIDKKEKVLELYLPEDIGSGRYNFEAFVTYTGREAMSTRSFEVKGDEQMFDTTIVVSGAVLMIVVFALIWRRRYKPEGK